MQYAVTAEDSDVAAAVRRVAVGRIDHALGALGGAGDRDEAVHVARKRIKQVRALVGLVSGALPRPKREDRTLRDLGRTLAGARDAKILHDTFATLVAEARRPLDVDATYAIRKSLADALAAGEGAADDARAAAVEGLAAVRARAAAWSLQRDGWTALSPGLVATYASARKAMKAALKSGDTAAMHAWRKAAKAHYHHLELVREVWPRGLKPAIAAADRLQETLGDHHDLALLAGHLTANAGDFGGERAIAPFAQLIGDRQQLLATTAASLGARLFAETPAAFAGRIRAYWKAWRRTAHVSDRLAA